MSPLVGGDDVAVQRVRLIHHSLVLLLGSECHILQSSLLPGVCQHLFPATTRRFYFTNVNMLQVNNHDFSFERVEKLLSITVGFLLRTQCQISLKHEERT